MSTPRSFKLSDKFIEQYIEATPPWGPVGYVVYKRTYARRLDEFIPGAEGTEEWYQTCRRVIEGMFDMQKQHCVQTGLPWNDAKAQRTAKEGYDRLFNGKWTPPGRGLWVQGTDFVKNRTGAALFNCAYFSTKDISVKGAHLFGWAMDALMLGVGVGFDTLGAGSLTVQQPQWSDTTFVVEDTRESWVEAVILKVNGYLKGTQVPRTLDTSQVRAKGEPIRGFGGTSSGPQPLIDLWNTIDDLYQPMIGELLNSTLIVDTNNVIGRCVVAGNVRRSAELSMGQPDDKEFINLKQDKQKLKDWRWCSNNSVEAKVGMNYSDLAKLSASNGEPGYIWLDNARKYGRMKDPQNDSDSKIMGFNPCVEQQLEHMEMCCLTESFMANHDTLEDWKRSLKFAYLYAKTVTLAKTHWPETNQIMLKNRRIGLSVTGLIQAMNKFGLRNVYNALDEAYDHVQKLDAIYSDWLCIPRSKRSTSIKPSGTVSKLFAATPGCHGPEHEYYLQRIRFAADSNLLPQLRTAGYPVEPCVYSPETEVVTFPIKEPHFVKGKAETSMWEQLEIAAQLQHYWSDNSVSVTITFKNDEAKDIGRALELYETRLKAVSFLRYAETGYEQAPMEPIDEARYLALSSQITPVTKFTFADQAVGSNFCTNDSCEITFSTE